MHENLVEKTVRLAKQSSRPVSEICRAAGVKQRWYHRFLAGDFSDPGVNKVIRLFGVLSESDAKARRKSDPVINELVQVHDRRKQPRA